MGSVPEPGSLCLSFHNRGRRVGCRACLLRARQSRAHRSATQLRGGEERRKSRRPERGLAAQGRLIQGRLPRPVRCWPPTGPAVPSPAQRLPDHVRCAAVGRLCPSLGLRLYQESTGPPSGQAGTARQGLHSPAHPESQEGQKLCLEDVKTLQGGAKLAAQHVLSLLR